MQEGRRGDVVRNASVGMTDRPASWRAPSWRDVSSRDLSSRDLSSRDLSWRDWADEARNAAQSLGEAAAGTLNPTLRLGVTGLSRAGKTVFITALVQALIGGGRLPVFRAAAEGRIGAVHLSPQPDDTVPRFEVEHHLSDLVERRRWPGSTRQIAELRLRIPFQSGRRFRGLQRTLTLDIVDYPGEWLLDLPLLAKGYAQWSAETIAASRKGARLAIAGAWHADLAGLDPKARADETAARRTAGLFTDYLRAGRDRRFALSTLPPGRFLMPGDLEGSPALTFAPLDGVEAEAASGSLQAMMERRYEAYKARVVRPFFQDHFARLDRQIVLVDALQAINAGPGAVRDLGQALESVLSAFRIGSAGWFSSLLRPKIQKILFAATKADHLHHTSHDPLEALLRTLAEGAIRRAAFSGAQVDVVALAAVRATREATLRQGGETLPSIIGTPEAGESTPEERFDGEQDVAVFPGQLPADPQSLLRGFSGLESGPADATDFRFLKFRPPRVEPGAPLPHIRLDRVMEFLLGDRLA